MWRTALCCSPLQRGPAALPELLLNSSPQRPLAFRDVSRMRQAAPVERRTDRSRFAATATTVSM